MGFRSGSGADSVAGTCTLPKPTGLDNSDWLFIFISCTSTDVVGTPSGFAVLENATSGSLKYMAFYKNITNIAGEPSNYAVSTLSSGSSGIIVSYRNTTTLDTDGSTGAVTSSTITAPTVTTSGANEPVLRVFTAKQTADFSSVPGTDTLRLYQHSGSGNPIWLGDETQVAAGATGTKTAGCTSTDSIGYTLAIVPATITNISLSRIFKWNVKTSISLNRIFKWNVRSVLSTTRIFKWNVRTSVAPFTRTFKWNVLLGVSISRIYKWNVLQSILINRIFKWNVRAVLLIDRIFKWNVRLSVPTIIRTFLWDVFAGWTRIPTQPDLWTEINENDATWTPEPVNLTTWR